MSVLEELWQNYFPQLNTAIIFTKMLQIRDSAGIVHKSLMDPKLPKSSDSCLPLLQCSSSELVLTGSSYLCCLEMAIGCICCYFCLPIVNYCYFNVILITKFVVIWLTNPTVCSSTYLY